MEEIPEGEEEPPEEDLEELPYKTGAERLELDVELEPSLLDEEDGGALEEEQREEPTIKHYRLLTPLSSRNQREVMAVFVDMYLRLRAEGKYNSYTPTSPENSGQQP